MKKKIAILGSTGSIGETSLRIFKKNQKKFDIILLSANSNYTNICKQIQIFKPKYFVINNTNVFEKTKKKYIKKKIKILNNFNDIDYNKVKFDITISSIVGIAGLYPTVKFINISKKVLISKGLS